MYEPDSRVKEQQKELCAPGFGGIVIQAVSKAGRPQFVGSQLYYVLTPLVIQEFGK